MNSALRRALRFLLSPDAEWRAIKDEIPDQRRILVSFVLPLASIPAVSWCLGLFLSAGASSIDFVWIAHRGLITYFGAVLSILLLAASMFVLAPLFTAGRDWPRALQVAAYSSSPVLLAGVVLVLPDLAFATLLAAFHSFFLQYVGVQQVLGAKEGEAAEYVALGIVLLIIASTLLGAFGSWLGLL